MKIELREYKNADDLYTIGKLLRRAFAQNRNWNAWSFARFDIWAQRRIADTTRFGNTDWQNDIALWQNADGDLIGAAAFTELSSHRWDPNQVALFCDADQIELYAAMLDWAEAHHAELAATQAERIAKLLPRKIVPHDALIVEAMTGNPSIESRLQARGYTRSNDWMYKRFKTLGDKIERVNLPTGFALKTIDTSDDLRAHMASVFAVFEMQDSVEAYRSIQRAPSYEPSLDLIVVAPNGTVASFCTVWIDHENCIAEFEPVGTHPDYRQRGLAKALLAEAHNRLRAMGIKTVGVESWSESPAANKLYDAAGLESCDKIFGWRKNS